MPHWATDQKNCAAHPPVFSCYPSELLTFLNHVSPAWWASLSSAPYTNEQSFYACLTVFYISLSGSFSFSLPSPPPHFCTESLYGDVTDKPLLDCCACGTAKYRVTFYGNWSEKIHPKDYPRKHKVLLFVKPYQLHHIFKEYFLSFFLLLKNKSNGRGGV